MSGSIHNSNDPRCECLSCLVVYQSGSHSLKRALPISSTELTEQVRYLPNEWELISNIDDLAQFHRETGTEMTPQQLASFKNFPCLAYNLDDIDQTTIYLYPKDAARLINDLTEDQQNDLLNRKG